MRIQKFFVALMMAAAPIIAFADFSDTTTVPEPATLALLGVGAVALLIARKNKRK